MQRLSPTRLRAWFACDRLHHYLYNERIEPIRGLSSARFGTLYHAGLNEWWRSNGDLPSAITAAQQTATEYDECDPYEEARVVELLRGYHHRWIGELATFDRIIGVEMPFTMPLTNPDTGETSDEWELTGYMDALAIRNGRAVIIEHKQTTLDFSPGATYWAVKRTDVQVSMYIAAAREMLDCDVEGCLYDVAQRPQQRPRLATPPEKRRYRKSDGKLDARQRETDESVDDFAERVRDAIAEAPERYYQRGLVVRVDAELEEHQRDLWHAVRAIQFTQSSGHAIRKPNACERFNQLCGFHPVCSGGASITDGSRYQPRRFRR